MTIEEFKSLKNGIVLNLVRFDRGEMSQETLMQNMKIMLGKKSFDEAIEIMNEGGTST
jgi:hypothetical protein